MRFAAYAGASTALAVAVVLHAFNQRPNFYSATVYLAQSQACRIVLLNLALLSTYTILRALQKALYGPLRAIEREQLWDKSWYAITETALAMTTFRDEVGVYFLVMFGTLLAGKIWAWISESRVDMLEQQPPANPKLFHARMLASLFISELFDILMLNYCVNTLINQPRPGMMVMYAFEYAVLFITTSSITLRYVLSLNEIVVMKKQTQAKLEERREEVRAARQDAERQAAEGIQEMPSTLEREEDIDENDIDVPGWEQKGKYILFLDLLTDFMKLVVYMFFFAMLLLFHGIPIHIIRDVYLTTRSFLKRISDFQKYRNATKDMNARYPDATAQELERDGTCIICREDMRPWTPPTEQPTAADGAQRPARPNRSPPDERQRPKKLPCGHILHLGCLKSWLERQQVCPTCRTSVLAANQSRGDQGHNQAGAAPGNLGQGGAGANNAGPAGQQGQNQQARNGHPNVLARQLRLGNWRFTFAAGQPQDVRQVLNEQRLAGPAPQQPQANRGIGGAQIPAQPQLPGTDQHLRRDPANIEQQLQSTQQQITQEIQRLHLSQHQLDIVRRLQTEYSRLRLEQSTARLRNQNAAGPQMLPLPQHPPQFGAPHRTLAPQPFPYALGQAGPHIVNAPGGYLVPLPQMQFPLPNQPLVYSSPPQQQNYGPGDANLPAGLTLPEGWNMMPLERAGPGRQAGAQATGVDALDLPDLGLPQVLPQTTERAASYGQSTQTPVNGFTSEQQYGSTNGATTSTDTSAQQAQSADATVDLPSWGNSNGTAQHAPAVDMQQPTQTNGEIEHPSTSSAQDLDGMADLGGASTFTKGKSRAPRVEDTDDGDDEGNPGSSSQVADLPPDDVD